MCTVGFDVLINFSFSFFEVCNVPILQSSIRELGEIWLIKAKENKRE
jgi:hypothetical protein